MDASQALFKVYRGIEGRFIATAPGTSRVRVALTLLLLGLFLLYMNTLQTMIENLIENPKCRINE